MLLGDVCIGDKKRGHHHHKNTYDEKKDFESSVVLRHGFRFDELLSYQRLYYQCRDQGHTLALRKHRDPRIETYYSLFVSTSTVSSLIACVQQHVSEGGSLIRASVLVNVFVGRGCLCVEGLDEEF